MGAPPGNPRPSLHRTSPGSSGPTRGGGSRLGHGDAVGRGRQSLLPVCVRDGGQVAAEHVVPLGRHGVTCQLHHAQVGDGGGVEGAAGHQDHGTVSDGRLAGGARAWSGGTGCRVRQGGAVPPPLRRGKWMPRGTRTLQLRATAAWAVPQPGLSSVDSRVCSRAVPRTLGRSVAL